MTVLWNRATEPKDVLWPLVVQRVRQVDAALDGSGVRLGIEFLGVKTLHPDRPYAFIQSMAEANELLDEAGAGSPWECRPDAELVPLVRPRDTLDTIRQTPAERIVLLHINDAKDAPRERLIDADRLVPGEGVIP